MTGRWWQGGDEARWVRWMAGAGDEWPQEPSVELGVEDHDPQPLGREGVGVRAGDALDVAVEPAQVVGHLRGRAVPPEESGHQPANTLVGESGDGVDDTQRAPVRAMARGSAKRSAPVRWSSRT